MLMRCAPRLARAAAPATKPIQLQVIRQFSTSKRQSTKNRVYTPVRRPEEFETYLAISTSTRTPLLTFWTASYCSTCKTVSPVLSELVGELGVGEEEGGVAYCEIEYDSPDIMGSDLASRFAITSMPTLLAFHKGFAAHETKLVDARRLRDKEGLKEWIRSEARSRDSGGVGGGGLFGGWFGGGGGGSR